MFDPQEFLVSNLYLKPIWKNNEKTKLSVRRATVNLNQQCYMLKKINIILPPPESSLGCS